MSLEFFEARGIAIAGTGAAFPSDLERASECAGLLTNADVYRRIHGPDFEAELARRGFRTDHPERAHGIRTRQWIHAVGEPLRADAPNALDLAIHAARRALEDARLSAGDVEAIVVATSTPPRITSSLAHAVGARLGTAAACFDVRAGGAGSLHAWAVAVGLLHQGAERVLVVAAEAPSLYIDPRDASTAVVYGDGAGALVLRVDVAHTGGRLGGSLGSAAPQGRAFTVPGLLPPRAGAIDSGQYFFQKSDETYDEMLRATWQGVLGDVATQHARHVERVALFLPYAVRRPQVEAAAQALGLPSARTFDTLAEHGCLGCAGPLVALHAARGVGRIALGDTLAFAAVGGGVAWGTLLWRV